MAATLVELDGRRLLVVDSTGPMIGSVQDALDLMGEAREQRAEVIVVPVGTIVVIPSTLQGIAQLL